MNTKPLKLIFLDFDGVMNRKRAWDNGYYGIDPVPAHLLSTLIELTDAKLVIHSAWRYMVLRNDVTLNGFANFLLTHGISIHKDGEHVIECVTRKDVGEGSIQDRVNQINEEVERLKPVAWIVLDDLPLDMDTEHFIHINGAQGLTAVDFLLALDKLRANGDGCD